MQTVVYSSGSERNSIYRGSNGQLPQKIEIIIPQVTSLSAIVFPFLPSFLFSLLWGAAEQKASTKGTTAEDVERRDWQRGNELSGMNEKKHSRHAVKTSLFEQYYICARLDNLFVYSLFCNVVHEQYLRIHPLQFPLSVYCRILHRGVDVYAVLGIRPLV